MRHVDLMNISVTSFHGTIFSLFAVNLGMNGADDTKIGMMDFFVETTHSVGVISSEAFDIIIVGGDGHEITGRSF